MRTLSNIFQNNRAWANDIKAQDPEFFSNLSKQQNPAILWIGCSDSRVPANQLMGLMPGEVFVHRNISNVVVHTDLNCLSVVQYAVEVLKVEHVIVCGHYGCGGVQAALQNAHFGLIDNWLRHVQDVARKHEADLARCANQAEQLSRLCELNVIEQVMNVCQTTIVQDAWARGQNLSVHGWIYSIHDGLLKDLDICITSPEESAEVYEHALADSSLPERS